MINAHPKLSAGVRPYMLVKANKDQYDEIYNELLNQKIRMKYRVNLSSKYLDSSSRYYNYDFAIKDALKTYQSNPELF